MARNTHFINTAGAEVTGTISSYKDIISYTGRGAIDYLVIKPIDNATGIDNYALEIDGTQYPFSIDLPFSSDFGMLTTPNNLMQTNRPIFFNESVKVQGYYNATTTVEYKYSLKIDRSV